MIVLQTMAVAFAMLWRPGLALMVTRTVRPPGQTTSKVLARRWEPLASTGTQRKSAPSPKP